MLQTHIFHDIPVLAFRHPLVGAPGIGFHGGPVIPTAAHQALRHTRYHTPADWFDGHGAVRERLPGEHCYIGPAYHHFGHVMAEMVHRILPALTAGHPQSWLMASTLGDTRVRSVADLPVFMQDVLGFFGIPPGRVTILTEDRVVERLQVSQQGSDFGGGPHPAYLAMLAALTERLLGTAAPHRRCVYVSRSALPGGGGFLGERVVEQALEAAGFIIARPETMPLLEQMRLYHGAEIVVFPEGSACHGVELLGPRCLGTAVLLARRADHMDIFARVLRPRADNYVALPPPPGTGSILRTLRHITVGPIDHRALFALLRERGCPAVPFDEATYRRQCEADSRRAESICDWRSATEEPPVANAFGSESHA